MCRGHGKNKIQRSDFMAIPQDTIAEIKYRNDIESVISQYVVLKRRGKNLIGLCPFHNEKTPSFTLYPENGSFYCFGCGVGGDVITFTGMIEHLDYVESLKYLADKAGIVIPDDNSEDNTLARLKQTILEINRESARFFHSCLMSSEGKWALDYLIGRGLNINTIRRFGLGCAPDKWDALLKHLTSKGYSIADMLQANVISKSQRGTYFDRFRNRVMFPIINLRGSVIAFSGRARPDDDKATGKYVNTQDTPVYKKGENLYGFNLAKNDCADRVILVEGNMDVISLYQAGFTNTVAALGTAFTVEQGKLLSRYTKELVICLDADSAGQKAVQRALETLKDSGLPTRVVVIPDGKDPDDYIKKNSPEKFKALIDKSESDIEYKLRKAGENIDTSSDDGKLAYLKVAAEILAQTGDELTIDLYSGRLAEKYGFSKNAVDNAIRRIRENNAKKKIRKEINDAVTPKYSRNDINPEKRFNKRAAVAEETIISVLFAHPDYFGRVEEALPPEKFITSVNRRIYGDIYNALKEEINIDISLFGQQYTPPELGYIVSLQSGVKAERNPVQLLNDSIEVLNKENLLKTKEGEENEDDWINRMQTLLREKKGE
ncbi:MAG: DNA primase [Ruminococcaceae bacterium]|nr:DNA primase [Oscillospiraceae bacterium]